MAQPAKIPHIRISPGEFFGLLIWDKLVASNYQYDDVLALQNELELTDKQFLEGAKWCADRNLIQFVQH